MGKEDNTKKTVLHHAAKRAKARKGNGKDKIDRIHQDIVRLLVESGVPMDHRDHNGCTALMFAAANNDVAVLQTLLVLNADMITEDFEKRTVLDYAEMFRHPEAVQILLAAGAKPGVIEDQVGEDDADEVEVITYPAEASSMDAGGALAAVAEYRSSSMAAHLPEPPE